MSRGAAPPECGKRRAGGGYFSKPPFFIRSR
jgi:hypothetical protein